MIILQYHLNFIVNGVTKNKVHTDEDELRSRISIHIDVD